MKSDLIVIKVHLVKLVEPARDMGKDRKQVLPPVENIELSETGI